MKIKVVDSNNKPIPNANVIPMVFNWGSLRSLINLTTDKNGYLEFTTGRGAFYLSVYSKEGKALVLIPSTAEKTIEKKITVTNTDFAGGWATLEYPENSVESKTQPENILLRLIWKNNAGRKNKRHWKMKR